MALVKYVTFLLRLIQHTAAVRRRMSVLNHHGFFRPYVNHVGVLWIHLKKKRNKMKKKKEKKKENYKKNQVMKMNKMKKKIKQNKQNKKVKKSKQNNNNKKSHMSVLGHRV